MKDTLNFTVFKGNAYNTTANQICLVTTGVFTLLFNGKKDGIKRAVLQLGLVHSFLL